MLFSQWATERTRDGKPLQLSFIGVRMAYVTVTPTLKIYVRLPIEMSLRQCGRHTFQMYVWDQRRRLQLGVGVLQRLDLDGLCAGRRAALLRLPSLLACLRVCPRG